MKRPKSVSKKKKVIIGLTGGFCSGKTAVSSLFRSLGAAVINADKIAHNVIKTGSLAHRRIIQIFGAGVLGRHKNIDREKLGEIVFNNKELLKKLNKLVHPEVIRQIKQKIKLSLNRYIVLDVPLLIESGLDKDCDMVVVVKVSKNTQIERAKKKSGLSRSECLKRINSQISTSRKVRSADFVIDNNGPIIETKKQVKRIWEIIYSAK